VIISRAISIFLILAGLSLLVAALVTDALGRGTASIATSMILWSVVAYLAPKSNDNWVRDALGVLHFSVLAIATFFAIALTAYVLFGSPASLSNELFTVILAFGLPAALVIPLVVKQLARRSAAGGSA
tara:strand:+ start:504 stop:887 length:384 start_codon:yes stop_codon:yes gene_type:complete